MPSDATGERVAVLAALKFVGEFLHFRGRLSPFARLLNIATDGAPWRSGALLQGGVRFEPRFGELSRARSVLIAALR